MMTKSDFSQGLQVVIAALGSSAFGCTTPHMTVPPDVAPATLPVPVEGRSMSSGMFVTEDFKIGDFAVANVSRGGKSTTRFGGFGGFKSSEESGYSFDLKQGAQSLHGECTLETSEAGANVGAVTISNERKKFACACGNEGAPVATVVMGASTMDKQYTGTLKAHDASFDVKAIYDREGAISDGNPAGYRVDGQGVQGAVDVLGPGRVWLAKTLEGDKRTDVTCVFAGLLLFKPTIKK
jgi:hypothetical protein